MGKTKRIISMVITVMMMVTLIPLQVYAEETFTVDYNLTNVMINGGVSTVTSGSAISVSITADEGYELPNSITVNGVFDDYNYDKATGDIEVTNIQSNIEIIAEGVEVISEVETGKAVIKYVDENGFELLPEETHDGLVLGEHTLNAPEIEGYTADFDSETINIEEDGQIRYIIFTYTKDEIIEEPVIEEPEVDEEPVIEEPEISDSTNLNIVGISCLNDKNIVIDECDILFENTDVFKGGTFIEIPLMIDELQFKNMYEEDWDFDLEVYFEIGRTDDTVEFIVESAEPKELTLYAIYSTPKAPQIKIVYADCSDLDHKNDVDLEEFGKRNSYDNHIVLNEEYYDLAIGENIIDIPSVYNELEWTLTGHDFLDSEFNYEFIEDEQGNKKGINLIAPYLIDLTLYVGYTLPEVEEEPVVQEPKPKQEQSNGGSRPTKEVEEIIISLKNIPQEDFVARYLQHKVITEEFKKATKNNIKFEVDKTLLNELLGDDLTPRIYRWSEDKQKLIAEDTKFNVKQGTDNIYTLTSGTDRFSELEKEEYYTIIAVKQPDFKDVEIFDYYIDKANGLGIIEGKEKDGVLNFEANAEITKSEYYTMIARIFGSMPLGETKMYDLLSLKSTEEADAILQGLELETDEWAKPYIASLLEKGYVTEKDLTENGNQITMESAMRTFNKLLSEVEDIKEVELLTKNFEGENTRYKMVQTLIKELVEVGW